MKKINLFLIGLLSIMTFGLGACSDDDDEVGSAADLVGKWQGVSATIVEKNGDAEQEVTRNINNDGVEFTADGKYVEGYYDEDGWDWVEWGDEDEDEDDYGSYTYKNRKLTLTTESGLSLEGNVKELTSSKLVIEFRDKYTEDGIDYDVSISLEFRRINN